MQCTYYIYTHGQEGEKKKKRGTFSIKHNISTHAKQKTEKHCSNVTQRNTPVPMPPITAGSEVPTTPPTTEGVGGPCGAMLGRYRQAKPSAAMSNSTKAGVTEAPCILASLGVVMETRHLTRVSGTGRPADCSLRSVSIVASFSSMASDQLMMSGSCQGSELWSWYSSSTERQLNGEPRRRKSLP